MFLPEAETIIVGEREAEMRIDRILSTFYPEQSRTYFQWLLRHGYVHLNGHPVKKRKKPEIGDRIEVRFVLAPTMEMAPEEIPLEILYEDDWVLAINKPAGMVVHPGAGNWNGTFVNALMGHCRELEIANDDTRPGIVHRLDKETSGVLIAAKTVRAQQKLQAQFAGRSVEKRYVAICVGDPGETEIRTRIGRHPTRRKEMDVVPEGGREAVTRCRSIASDGKISLVLLTPVTGRTHQLRVHMRYRGTPILGDPTYGSIEWNQKYRIGRQLLHAYCISFIHPIYHDQIELFAPLPSDMLSLIKRSFPNYPLDRLPCEP